MSHISIIFDKSTLQSLSHAEARCLGLHFRSNITPILYVEILADLHKTPPEGRTPEQVVAGLAAKIPTISSLPNMYHSRLAIGDLLGFPAEMNRVPVIGGGKVIEAGGRRGVYHDEAPEAAAFHRWQSQDFQGVEREYARVWRAALERLDLDAIRRAVGDRGKGRYRTIEDVKSAAQEAVHARGRRYRTLHLMLDILSVPTNYRKTIIDRWKKSGGPELTTFAPYGSYVFLIEVFFYLGIMSRHIAGTRPSHRMDLAYLFYLPFCSVFTSHDRNHKIWAPLFLGDDQVFVEGEALKTEMLALHRHYEALPEEVRSKGAFTYAAYPPLEGDFLTSRLFDRLVPGWRHHAANPIEITPELNAKIMKDLRPIIEAIEHQQGKTSPADPSDAENTTFTYRSRDPGP